MRRSLPFIVLVVLIAAGTAEAAGPTVNQLDVKVKGLWVTNPGGGTEILVANEGDDVYIHCSWTATTAYSDYYVAKDIKFTNAINIDGKLLATVNDVVKANHWGKGKDYATPGGSFIEQKWKAAGPGKHAIQCKLDLTDQFKEKPEWKQDSQRTIQLVVRREVKEGEIPAPRILNPPEGSKYQLGDHLKIPVGFRIDDAFFMLSKDLIIPQVWFRMELEYDGPPGARTAQKKSITLSGGAPFSAGSTQLSNNPVEDFLTMQEMKKKGVGEAGHYTLTVYLSTGGKYGPKARRSFDIHGPLSVKGGSDAKGSASPPAPPPKAPVPPPKIPLQPPKAR